jgi:hypothetical protein
MACALTIDQWSLDKIIPYARNARTHSDVQVAQIAASIKEFGFVNPILAGADHVIIAGHGRLLAARKLGMAEELARRLESQDANGGLTDEDAVPELEEVPISVAGDLWRLGDHRVLCGDATAPSEVDRLIARDSVDLVFTAPLTTLIMRATPKSG